MKKSISEDDRFGRLPKWAQSAIVDLERDLKRVEEFAEDARLSHAEEGSGTSLNLGSLNKNIPLPRHARLRFDFGLGVEESLRDFIEVSRQGDTVQVHAGAQLRITPHVTNVVHLEVQP